MPNSPWRRLFALSLELSLDGIAYMGCDVTEVLYARSIVHYLEVMIVLLLASDYGHVLRPGVYRVLNELGYGLEGIVLRERDDGYDIPMIAYLELA